MLLYIDPGTGSMLFSVLVSIFGIFVFFFRRMMLKLIFIFNHGKAEKISHSKIPYVIFCENKRYWYVFMSICEEFERRRIDISYWTASPDDPALEQTYKYVHAKFIGEGNKAYASLNLMNAGTVLATTPGLDVYQWKRSRNVDRYVHIFHSVSDGTGYRMFGLCGYDAILAGGPIVEHYQHIINKKQNQAPKEVVVTGITYMDYLKKRLNKYAASGKGEANRRKTVLLAPSWGASGILSKYGAKILSALLATDYNVVVRPHPQSLTSEKKMIESLMGQFPDSDRLKWNFDNDNFHVLYNSDIMISDFSGVIYDYAFIFNKPVMYAKVNFNPAPYDAAWLDETKWMIQKLPDLGKALSESDFQNMQAVLDGLKDDPDLDRRREEIRSLCWQNIGGAAEKVCDYMIAGGNK